MALDREQLIKVYCRRLVNSLVPAEFGDEYAESLTAELIQQLLSKTSTGATQGDTSQISDHVKQYFLSNNAPDKWVRFQNILNTLTRARSIDQICSYLRFLCCLQGISLRENHQSHSRPLKNGPIERNSIDSTPTSKQASFQKFNRSTFDRTEFMDGNKTLHQSISPYYETIPDDDLLTYLPYSLLGLDTKLLQYQHDGTLMEIPPSINNSYSGILHNMLESSLIYMRLKRLVEDNRGKKRSAITSSFMRSLETELELYSNHINTCMSKPVSSILVLYNHIFPKILELRLIYSLSNDLDMKGYDFLSKLYTISKFGDKTISVLADKFFQVISKGYYETLESWILKGELLDNSEDFFIQFDVDANNINDIIQFYPDRVPEFIPMKTETAFKCYQIGKILIFLSKYCKELSWTNEYYAKYSEIFFHRNKGLQFMSKSTLLNLVDSQFQALLSYFTVVAYEKYHLFEHLKNFKNFLLTGSNDFIESLIENGTPLLNEPSNTLTPSQLSKILIQSISSSSALNSEEEFRNRLDARILDLSHGNIGWEVFTLEYKITDLPVDHILNYNNAALEYLKLFNFLWKMKHFSVLLGTSFVDSCNLRKTDLRKFNQRFVKIKRKMKADPDVRLNLREKKVVWLMKSCNSVNLVRHELTSLLNKLLKHLCFDVIEDKFQKLIVQKLFSVDPGSVTKIDSGQGVPVLNDSFYSKIRNGSNLLAALPDAPKIAHNVNDLTFDELISTHQEFLEGVISFKLLNESKIGPVSGVSFVYQMYHFLELIFSFVKSAESFTHSVIDYVSIANIEENIASNEVGSFDDDLNELEFIISKLTSRIYNELYSSDFKPHKERFVRDLRSDIDLKDLGRLI
ncbi:Piso0_005238 [Millerozyma farinosa CBS 7064]|uniref:Spindle pole body component n=1 Tax=Pichia sorbitophila (strain ATCC MYA-4447 / BCRC 22081 / CBS 7064 / NBRC 10061 / NRRL Y-12695) TaxID=559304 RepID=G8Y1M6_PICSO|nr:Piso0_005238 [Millerozyma farinosa CBS 7064]